MILNRIGAGSHWASLVRVLMAGYLRRWVFRRRLNLKVSKMG